MIEIQLPNTVMEINPLHVIMINSRNVTVDAEPPEIGKSTTYVIEIVIRQIAKPFEFTFSSESLRDQIRNMIKHEVDGTNGKRRQEVAVGPDIMRKLKL